MGSTNTNPTLHPRPQLQRAVWISLDGPWRFAFDSGRAWNHPAEIAEWPLVIQVPFAPESKLSGIGDSGFHPVCWYERDFDLERDSHARGGSRVLLHFGAVDYFARVWVNGHALAEHEGGHVPFTVDITRALQDGKSQRVTVQVF